MVNSILFPFLLIFLYIFFGSALGLYLIYFQVFIYVSLSILAVYDFLLLCVGHYVFLVSLSEMSFQYEFFSFQLDFCFDRLSLFMLIIVLSISSVVTGFSVWYMKGDPNYLKFFFI